MSRLHRLAPKYYNHQKLWTATLISLLAVRLKFTVFVLSKTCNWMHIQFLRFKSVFRFQFAFVQPFCVRELWTYTKTKKCTRDRTHCVTYVLINKITMRGEFTNDSGWRAMITVRENEGERARETEKFKMAFPSTIFGCFSVRICTLFSRTVPL